jgi:hypothetical protein
MASTQSFCIVSLKSVDCRDLEPGPEVGVAVVTPDDSATDDGAAVLDVILAVAADVVLLVSSADVPPKEVEAELEPVPMTG